MKTLHQYINEDFKISHKINSIIYKAVKPKTKGICLQISIAHHNKHIEINTVKYFVKTSFLIDYKIIYNNDNDNSGFNNFSVKRSENGYYTKQDDYWDKILLFDNDAMIFLQNYLNNKKQKFDARIFLPTTEKSLFIKKYCNNHSSLEYYTNEEINTMIEQIKTQNETVN